MESTGSSAVYSVFCVDAFNSKNLQIRSLLEKQRLIWPENVNILAEDDGFSAVSSVFHVIVHKFNLQIYKLRIYNKKRSLKKRLIWRDKSFLLKVAYFPPPLILKIIVEERQFIVHCHMPVSRDSVENSKKFDGFYCYFY